MSKLAADFVDRLVSGLVKSNITNAAEWAFKKRKIRRDDLKLGRKILDDWSFDAHPWLYDMHVCPHPHVVGQKAAQLGFSETVLNVGFFNLDIKKLDVLYLLPTVTAAQDFSRSRFDPALEESPDLKELFSDVDNVGLKRAGSQCLYVRGTKSRTDLKSIPVSLIIYDEVAEMDQTNMGLAEQRQSGQSFTSSWKISTPTVSDMNINVDFKQSTQDRYVFQCPKCSRQIFLTFPDDLVIRGESADDPDILKSYVQCPACKNKLEHELKREFLKNKKFGGTGNFVPQFENKRFHGFGIHQLYSTTRKPVQIARLHFDGLSDDSKKIEYYNSSGGMPYELKGARISKEQFNKCKKNFVKGEKRNNCVKTLGIDVGSVLHMVVKEFKLPVDFELGGMPNEQVIPRIVEEVESSGDPNDFAEAYALFNDYNCMMSVVDAEPETRAAMRFAYSLRNFVYLCDYQVSQKGRSVTCDENLDFRIKVNRTNWFDLVLGRYKEGLVQLPKNISLQFQNHLTSFIRTYRFDKNGNPVGHYDSPKDDHFGHADLYSEVAFYMFVKNLTATDTIR